MLSVVRRSNRPAVVLALLVLAMFAVSCGTNEQPQQSEGTTPPATTSQPAPVGP